MNNNKNQLMLSNMPHKAIYTEFLLYVDDAKQCKSAEEFIAEYGYPQNCPYDADNLVLWCKLVYCAAHNDWRELLWLMAHEQFALGTATAMSKYIEIPRRTIQAWVSGSRVPPAYMIQLVVFAIISELPTIEDAENT